MFTTQIWGFSEQPVQFWVCMSQRTRTDYVLCVGVAEIENKSKMNCPIAFITLFTFIYFRIIFVVCELISLEIDK